MVFIVGGAYQGKLDYAKDHYPVSSICDCADGKEPDLNCDAITGLYGYIMNCLRTGEDPCAFFAKNEAALRDKVLINTDVSCGVVPVSKEERAFREMNGRVNGLLAGMADEVVQVFCGLGKKMK